jgi:hypothetical protein
MLALTLLVATAAALLLALRAARTADKPSQTRTIQGAPLIRRL